MLLILLLLLLLAVGGAEWGILEDEHPLVVWNVHRSHSSGLYTLQSVKPSNPCSLLILDLLVELDQTPAQGPGGNFSDHELSRADSFASTRASTGTSLSHGKSMGARETQRKMIVTHFLDANGFMHLGKASNDFFEPWCPGTPSKQAKEEVDPLVRTGALFFHRSWLVSEPPDHPDPLLLWTLSALKTLSNLWCRMLYSPPKLNPGPVATH